MPEALVNQKTTHQLSQDKDWCYLLVQLGLQIFP